MIRMTLSEEQMNKIAEEFEQDEFEHEDNPVFTGSHFQLAKNDNQTVTVVYETADVQKANNVAQRLGCTQSQLYRKALKQYLQSV